MSEKKILSISFVRDGKRVVIKASASGSFKFLVANTNSGRPRMSYKMLSARQVIEHEMIKGADPVLTLTNGDKLRVYVGGDSSYLPAMSEGIIEKHDKSGIKKDKKPKKVIIPNYPASKDTKDMNDTDEYDFEFPWDDSHGF